MATSIQWGRQIDCWGVPGYRAVLVCLIHHSFQSHANGNSLTVRLCLAYGGKRRFDAKTSRMQTYNVDGEAQVGTRFKQQVSHKTIPFPSFIFKASVTHQVAGGRDSQQHESS